MKKLILLLFFSTQLVFAQQDSLLKVKLTTISSSIHYASIFAHSKSVQNTAGSNPVGLEIIYANQSREESMWQKCHCFLNTGFGLNYFDFDNKVLGKALSLFYLIEPQFKLSPRLKFLVAGYGGFSYLSNPYNSTKNPTNMSYSLPYSAYVGLGLGLQYLIHPRWQVALLGNFLHVSNGGIKDPNKGINWPSLNIRASYSLTNNSLPSYNKKNNQNIRFNRFDIGVLVSSKTVAVGEKERFLIWGAYGLHSWQVSSINALTLGTEFIVDYALKERLQRANLDRSYFRSGLLIGHEFLLGKFVFSQQLGYYLFNEAPYFTSLYHKWGINYYTNSGLYLGTQLLVHRQVANFIDFRIGYSFKREKR